MYVAKETRCGHVFYEPGYERDNRAEIELIPELRRGIERGELFLEYQPKMELSTGRIYGVEALVRWEHPERGRLGPDSFVPLAENTGLIAPLTSFVLETSIAQCAEWQRRGLPLTVSVNISVRSLLMANLSEQIAEILKRYDVDPGCIQLEITESTMMADPARAMRALTQLGDAGLGLAVDDFGTGYSSLTYLKDLPVDEIKIDRSFVTPMVDSREAAVIVRSTIEIARNLGLCVVAEGVEDQRTLDALMELGCDRVQGYYLSRPVSAERIRPEMAAHVLRRPPLKVAV
jgi:EAL domain-containing protein (putative c-di-GMP-specific phosphodiesterase class I)